MSKIIRKCRHCKGDLAIRNPTGKCDHLYYPESCDYCSKKKYTLGPVMPAPVGFPTRPGGPGPSRAARTRLRAAPGVLDGPTASPRAPGAVGPDGSDGLAFPPGMGGPFSKKQLARTDKDFNNFLRLRKRRVKQNIGKEGHHAESED